MAEPSPVPGRTLILLRHAKAEREVGLADIDRPLTTRGRADAGAAGAWLAHHGNRPDQVICSPSRRTRQTWEGVGLAIAEAGVPAAATAGVPGATGAADAADAAGSNGYEYQPAVWYEPALYHGTAVDLLKLLREVAPETGTLLVIGHNPTVSEVSELLDPAHPEADWMRTCGMAVHRLGGEWADVRPGTAPIHRRHTARAA